MILGDNIFYGNLDFFVSALAIESGACIFGYQVRDPERYGVVEFGLDGRAISLEEKPKKPKSQYAVPGLYVYDQQVVEYCKSLRPSARGELEITDLNLIYLRQNSLHVRLLGRADGVAGYWHADKSSRGRQLHRDDRTPARIEGGLPRGSCFTNGIYRSAAD